VAEASSANAPKKTPDRAAAYYHFTLAHIYEELVASYARSEFANKAVEEYKLAIANDPDSEYLNAGLAELYAKTGRIRDAVLEAQDIIKRDPNNLEAHKLLGRIYLRSLGDMPSNGNGSENVLKLAIEQAGATFRSIDAFFNERTPVDENLVRFSYTLIRATQEILPAILWEVTADQPDYLLYDSLCIWGKCVAQILRVPAIASVTTLARPHSLLHHEVLASFLLVMPTMPISISDVSLPLVSKLREM